MRDWPAIARLLSRDGIWLLPWFLFSLFGLTLMLAVGAEGLGWKLVAELFVDCAAVWGLLGGGAALMSAWRSLRQAWRLGFGGFVRPRIWFELGRLSMAAFAFFLSVNLMCFLLLLVPGGKRLFANLDRLGTWPLAGLLATYAAILATVTLGYAVSWLNGRSPRGCAFRSSRAFYLVTSGIALLGFAVAQWPPPNVWPWGAAWSLAAILGVAITARGMLVFSAEYDKKPQHPPHGEIS
jgi:hypothetical protein